MRIIVATVRIPFVHGGAEVLAAELVNALRAAKHEADLVAMPFNPTEAERIPDQMLACALTSLDEIAGVSVDRLIALKFPAYLIPHPNKVVWLLHQHRQAFDLWENPFGDLRRAPRGTMIRDIIRRADSKVCSDAKAVFTLSQNVTRRLREFLDVDSIPLHHPPAGAENFYCADDGGRDYFFFPSRLSPNKRQELVLRALALTRNPVRLKFSGLADSPPYGERLMSLARELGVQSRVEWLGFVREEEKRDLYARALAVVFPPFDEDYGYVTLEAMLASKPVITCDDSGGPLEFVLPGQTGLVVTSDPEAVAEAMDRIWQDHKLATKLGQSGRRHYDSLGLSWTKVVDRLLE